MANHSYIPAIFRAHLAFCRSQRGHVTPQRDMILNPKRPPSPLSSHHSCTFVSGACAAAGGTGRLRVNAALSKFAKCSVVHHKKSRWGRRACVAKRRSSGNYSCPPPFCVIKSRCVAIASARQTAETDSLVAGQRLWRSSLPLGRSFSVPRALKGAIIGSASLVLPPTSVSAFRACDRDYRVDMTYARTRTRTRMIPVFVPGKRDLVNSSARGTCFQMPDRIKALPSGGRERRRY